MFTVVVVLPTPPFWLATTITRVRCGRGSGSLQPAALPDQQRVLDGPRQRGGVVARQTEAGQLAGRPVRRAGCRVRTEAAQVDRSGGGGVGGRGHGGSGGRGVERGLCFT